MTDDASSRTGQTLPTGHELLWYTVERVLGQGGFGVTYLARDRNLGRSVALKEYLPSSFARRRAADLAVRPLSDEHESTYRWGLESFMNEARTLARFKHHSIVQVQAVFEEHGTAYMAMEYERGESLGEVISRGSAEIDQAFLRRLLLPVMDGLQLVHDAGFIHRDIKPSNIYLRADGSPVLIDFGSSRQLSGQDGGDEMTALISLGYTPIEQYSATFGQQGPWTDVYALAASLYHAVTGIKPTDALGRQAAAWSGRSDPMKPLATLAGPGYDIGFLLAIDEALRLMPDERPRSLQAWQAILERRDEPTVLKRHVPATTPSAPPREDAGETPTAAPDTPAPAADAATAAAARRDPPGTGPGTAVDAARVGPTREGWLGPPALASTAAIVALLAGGWWLVAGREDFAATVGEAEPHVVADGRAAGEEGTVVFEDDEASIARAGEAKSDIIASALRALPEPDAGIVVESPLSRARAELETLDALAGLYARALDVDASSVAAREGMAAVADRFGRLAASPIMLADPELHAAAEAGLRASVRGEVRAAETEVAPGRDGDVASATSVLETLLDEGATTRAERERLVYGLAALPPGTFGADPRVDALVERFKRSILERLRREELVPAARMLELAMLVRPEDAELALLARYLEGEPVGD